MLPVLAHSLCFVIWPARPPNVSETGTYASLVGYDSLISEALSEFVNDNFRRARDIFKKMLIQYIHYATLSILLQPSVRRFDQFSLPITTGEDINICSDGLACNRSNSSLALNWLGLFFLFRITRLNVSLTLHCILIF